MVPCSTGPAGRGRVRITPLGRPVLAHGQELLARAAEADDAIARFRSGAGRVDLATFQTVTNVLLPELVSRLRDEQPDSDIRLFEEETDTPGLDRLDLMFFDGPGPEGLDRKLLLEDDHVLIARRGHFPAGPVELSALHEVAMVGLPAICDQGRVEDRLVAAGVRPRFVFRTEDNQAVVSVVRAGLGCAVMPLLAFDLRPDDPTVELHPLVPALPPRQIFLLWQGTLSPLAQRVVELATEVAAARRGPGVRVPRPRRRRGGR